MQSLSFSWARLRASAPGEAVRRFVRETDATMTVEAVLVLPFYLQFFVASYAFFDAFRTASVNEKAAYTIADVITRRNAGAPVDTNFINWMNELFDYLLEGRATETWIRVTSVTYSDTDEQYEVEWSVGTRGQAALNDADLTSLASRLPIMPGGDTVILVETETRFGLGYTASPYLFSALGDQELTTFIFTRPRFTPRIEFSG